jgi:DNA-binding transcriptional LysR family regulator
VTLSAPPVLVMHLLTGKLAHFQARHPNILLSLAAQGQQVSLSHREADVALRLVRPTEAANVVRRIGTMAFGLYAHRDYVHLATPQQWRFIAFDPSYADMPQQQWLLGIAGGRPIACELNHIGEHLMAVRASAGVAGLPCFIGDVCPDLVRLDQDAAPFARDIWLAVHDDLRDVPAIRAVMAFVTETVAGNPCLALR